MARQLIDIGIQGNDGTGDSIRESFRKVNENFSEIYALFGKGDGFGFANLIDAPPLNNNDKAYGPNQIIMANSDGSRLAAKSLVAKQGSGLAVSFFSDKIELSSNVLGLADEQTPALSHTLNTRGNPVVGLPDLTTPEQEDDALALANAVHGGFTNTDSFAISKGYGDKNYLKVDENGGIIGALRLRDEPILPESTDADYDQTLTGNYLKTEAIQRQHAVYRGGDSMTGTLKLHDHPTPLEGYGTPNGASDLQAATKFYVDNNSFSSSINLYVSVATGDDLQQKTPIGKEGRFWQYAYKTIGAAALQAENLINLASQEPGPYRQKIAYTKNNGADQVYSTLQLPGVQPDVIYGSRLIDGNINVYGYRDAFWTLQNNRDFIQAETIAYINNKYVNRFSYDKVKCQRDVIYMLDAIGYDLALESTFNITRAASSYFSNLATKVTGSQLTQTIESIKFARDQLLNLSYSDVNLQNYIKTVVDAICFDLVFQSNYQSISAGLAFNTADTRLESDQMVEILANLAQEIRNSLIENTDYESSEINALVIVNFNLIINVIRLGTIPEVYFNEIGSSSFNISATTINGLTNLITINNSTDNDLTVNSTIRFKSPVGGGLTTSDTYYISSISGNNIAISKQINGEVVDLSTYSGNPISAIVSTGTSTGQKSSRDLLLGNIKFLQADIISYLKNEFSSVSVDRAAWEVYVQDVVETIVYDLMYDGNSQSIELGSKFWFTNGEGQDQRIISDAELPLLKATLKRINLLSQDIVRNNLIFITYQQSINQYSNETYTNGQATSNVIKENLLLIESIIDNKANIPLPIDVISPDETYVNVALKDIRNEIRGVNDVNVIGYEEAAVDYVDTNFDPITDTATLNQISTLFQIAIDLLTLGLPERIDPVFNNTRGYIGSDIGYVHAQTLLMKNTEFVARETIAYINNQISGNSPQFAGFTFTTEDQEYFDQDITYLIEALCYDIMYGGNSAAMYIGSTFRVPDNNVSLLIEILSRTHLEVITPIVSNQAVSPVYTGGQYIDTTGELTQGNIANPVISNLMTVINNKVNGQNPVGGTVYPNLNAISNINPNFLRLQIVLTENDSAYSKEVANNTTVYLDENFQGGFSYNEVVCQRDVGLMVDAVSIDVITGGNYQSVNTGKSYYRNSSARAIAIGSQYRETLDGIRFVKDLILRLLNQIDGTRYQTLVEPVFLPNPTVSAEAKQDTTDAMDSIISIIENGFGAAPVTDFGTGIWEVLIDNGGGYIDQGAANNIDIIPAKVIVGATTGAYGNIVKYIQGQESFNDIIHFRLTKPGFFGRSVETNSFKTEELEFGETVKDINITIFVESGIYYEDYPLRLPSNVSIKGDEFRRSIVRPRDRASQSPWRKIFFYRDAIIDAMELGLINFNIDYSSSTKIRLSGTVNTITATMLSSSSQPVQVPSSWVGKILIGDYFESTTATVTSASEDYIVVSNISIMEVNKPVIFTGTTFGGILADATYYVTSVKTVGSSNRITISSTMKGDTLQLTSGTGSMTVSIYKKGKAIVESVSNNVMNCEVIYPFISSTFEYSNIPNSGGFAWHLYDPINYGRHYLTNPLDITSPAKNNKEIDVLLCNDAVRVSNITFQGHGGFAMILDPENQIKTKSPYGQVCSSFSQSNNRKRFAGGQFVDGFAGRLNGTITSIEYNAITNFVTSGLGFNGGSGYIPSTGIYTYTNVPVTVVESSKLTDPTVINELRSGATVNVTITDGSVTNIIVNQGGTGYVATEYVEFDSSYAKLTRELTVINANNSIGLLRLNDIDPKININVDNKVRFTGFPVGVTNIGGIVKNTVYRIKTINENDSITLYAVNDTTFKNEIDLTFVATPGIIMEIFSDNISAFSASIQGVSGEGIKVTVQGTTSAYGTYISGGTGTSIIVNEVNGTILPGMPVSGVGFDFSQTVETVTDNSNGTYTVELSTGAKLIPLGTIVFGISSGLDIRPPRPPCAFYVQGDRYQINDVTYHDPDTATVVLTLDVNTPYDVANKYDNDKCSRDVGIILESATIDMAIGSNFQSITAGLSYLRNVASKVIISQQLQTVAGINKARDLALNLVSPSQTVDIAAFTNNVDIINDIINLGANAAPEILYPTVTGLTSTDAVKVKNVLQANRTFIQNDFTSWIATNAVSIIVGGLKAVSDYDTVSFQKNVGYIIDAICYDTMYGTSTNSMTVDAIKTYWLAGESLISSRAATLLQQAFINNLVPVIQKLITAQAITPSTGNNFDIITTYNGQSLTYITTGSAKYSHVTTLGGLLSDYIIDGAFTGSVSRIEPAVSNASRTAIIAQKSAISASVIEYLNQGGELNINVEMGGNKSMLANDFAMINDLGYGIVCTNGGISEQVSTFTYYCHVHYWANNGGQIRSVSGSNAHGNYGMRASGFDVTERPDAVNLAYNMAQVARVYKQSLYEHDMEPTVNKQALAVYVYDYEYKPTNTSELEIDHGLEGLGISRYEISSVEYTPITLNDQTILKLNLSTAGTSGTSSTGLATALHHGQQVVIRTLQNVKFNNIDNVRPTRPSTALQYNDNLAGIYRILAYNLAESTGELLPDNVAILQSDTSFNYYKFTTDVRYITFPDPLSSLSIHNLTRVVNPSTINVTVTTSENHGYSTGQTVYISNVVPTAYNGVRKITGTPALNQLTYTINTTTDPGVYAGFGFISDKSQGYTVGDSSIAVVSIANQATIDIIKRDGGTFITSWSGRVHRVTDYISQANIATGVVNAKVVNTPVGTFQIKLTNIAGTILPDMRITGGSFPYVGPNYVTVDSVIYPDVDDINKIYTINLNYGSLNITTILQSLTVETSLTFGEFKNSYITVDPNPVNNITTDGEPIKGLRYNGIVSFNDYINTVIPQTGIDTTKTLVTYDIPWDAINYPVIDGYYNIQGSSNTEFNGYYQVVGAISQTSIVVSDITNLVEGMVLQAKTGVIQAVLSPNETTIIQSVDKDTNTIVVSPACWTPVGAGLRAVLYATVQTIAIVNGQVGTGYTEPPIITLIGGGLGDDPEGTRVDALIPATVRCTIDQQTGSINELIITNPGYGYLSVPDYVVSPTAADVSNSNIVSPVLEITISQPVEEETSVQAGVSTNRITVAYDTDPGVFSTTGLLYVVNGAPVSSAAAGTYTVGTSSLTGYSVSLSTVGNINPTNGQWCYVDGNQNPLFNGMYRAYGTPAGSNVNLFYPYNPGTINTSISISITGATNITNTAPYIVTFTIADPGFTPTIGSKWTVDTNVAAYDAIGLTVISASSTEIKLSYGNINPGFTGVAVNGSATNYTTITKVIHAATSTFLGISKPFQTDSSHTLRLGYSAGAPAQITVRISTCRATGHDFLDIGTGGYSTTNFPYQIYGNPALSKDQSREIKEDGVGRVFYVSTDQNGIFRVGRFFTVDQGTGSVTFSASIALSNLDGLGFKRGVVVSEFSTDTTMTNNAPEIVPVQSAVRGFVDRRLGLDYSGAPIPVSNLIGPGFLPLDGSLSMKDSLDMGNKRIRNLYTPTSSFDATTKDYVDRNDDAFNALQKLNDTNVTSPLTGQVLVFEKKPELNIASAIISTSYIVLTFADEEITVQPYVQGEIVTVSGVSVADYNGVWTVYSCSPNAQNRYRTVTFISPSTTIPNGTGGVVYGGTWVNVSQPIGPDIAITYAPITNILTTNINNDVIVNSMISANAAIDQSKIALSLTSERAASPIGTAAQKQAASGLATFKDTQFKITDGWVELKDSTSAITGVTLNKIQYINSGILLGNRSGLAAVPYGITPADVVTDGDGIKNAAFNPTTPITSIGATSRAMVVARPTTANEYSTIDITENGEGNALLKTLASGRLVIVEGSTIGSDYVLDVTGKLRATKDIVSNATITANNFVLTNNKQTVLTYRVSGTATIDLTTASVFYLNVESNTIIKLTGTPTDSTAHRVTLVVRQNVANLTTQFTTDPSPNPQVVFMNGGISSASATASFTNIAGGIDVFTFYAIRRPILDSLNQIIGWDNSYVCADTAPTLSRKITDFDERVRLNRLDQLAKPTSDLDLNNNKIINLAAPIDTHNAATKSYVDGKYREGNGLSFSTSTYKFSVNLRKDGLGTNNSGLDFESVTGALYISGSIGTITSGTWSANTIDAAHGGTGLGTGGTSATSGLAVGDMLYAGSANATAFSKLAAPAANSYLTYSTASSSPAWASLPISTTNGGTGFGSYAIGDVLYANTTSALAKLSRPASGTGVLTCASGSTPAWTDTIAVTEGGTGYSTYATGDLLFGNSTSTLSKLARPTSGTQILSCASDGTPTWSSSSPSVANAVTFNDGGSGVASGTTYNGSTVRIVSYNTIGAIGISGYQRLTMVAGASGSTTAQVDTLQIYQPTGNSDAFITFHVGSDYAAHFGLDGATNDLFYGGWSVGTSKHKIYHAGNISNENIQVKSLGVNTAASGTAGEIRATNDITAFYTSDQRLKENIVNIKNPLEKLLKINGVTFDWIDSYIEERGGEDGLFVRKADIGVIAQEIEAVMPEVVGTRENGTKGVRYEKIVPLLIESIKEQQKTIDNYKSRIDKLEEMVTLLMNKSE